MRVEIPNVPVTLDFDNKMHGALSVVSYTVEYSNLLGYTEDERNKIINEISMYTTI